MALNVIDAISHRQRFEVEVLRPVRRWKAILNHLASHHPDDLPTADPNAVAHPENLAHFHNDLHRDHVEPWIVRGEDPGHAHRHLSPVGRLVNWVNWL